MEFGLDASLPIYSGGLGVLAGDAIKAAGDSGAPLVGIGLFWSRGYTRQTLGADCTPVDAFPDTPRDRLQPLDVNVEIEVEGKSVPLSAYRVDPELARGELVLLEPSNEADRWITERLYGGGTRDRVAQEMLLGIGGVRVLAALGRSVDVYHFNEGHAVFAGLELVSQAMAAGDPFETALASTRQRVVFTTHTPVPAGNEVHTLEELEALGAFAGLTREQAVAIGGDPFSMTAAGLRLSRLANGVAELHGETSREMWADVTGAAPIIAITNGVHRATWQDPSIDGATSGEALWEAHLANKRALFSTIEERTGEGLDETALTIGFARRATTYKRADLILGDAEALGRLLGSGVQLIFAGKAHPADRPGKLLVSRIAGIARRHKGIVFLEDYDMILGAALTRGCDVWLNNPRRPQEACGTSGMKAAMNGVLNLSILDGWWPEGCHHGETGWRIDAGQKPTAPEQDAADRNELFRVLHEEVLPSWRNRDRWVGMMRASIEMSRDRFSARRMLADYYEKLYPLRPE